MIAQPSASFFFFFNDTATTEIYTLSLHDALPISMLMLGSSEKPLRPRLGELQRRVNQQDRKSTRLNSSHGYISYAVFCLKKKKQNASYKSLQTCSPPRYMYHSFTLPA